MENAVTVMVAVAGLFFSFSCALLIEELVFGGLCKVFFARQKEPRPGTN